MAEKIYKTVEEYQREQGGRTVQYFYLFSIALVRCIACGYHTTVSMYEVDNVMCYCETRNRKNCEGKKRISKRKEV